MKRVEVLGSRIANLDAGPRDGPVWARPGALIPVERVAWYMRQRKSLQAIEIGDGLHYVQENNSDAICQGIAEWLAGP